MIVFVFHTSLERSLKSINSFLRSEVPKSFPRLLKTEYYRILLKSSKNQLYMVSARQVRPVVHSLTFVELNLEVVIKSYIEAGLAE